MNTDELQPQSVPPPSIPFRFFIGDALIGLLLMRNSTARLCMQIQS